MQYILKNKDIDVLYFEVLTQNEIFKDLSVSYSHIKDAVIVNESLLPIQIKKDNLPQSLETFIKRRKLPQNREFADNIIETYCHNGKEMLMDYIDISFALSLNDAYSIVPYNADYKWADINLYDNNFCTKLQRAAFGDRVGKIRSPCLSPEYSTHGMLKKCWHRQNGKIYLYKGSTYAFANGGKEAYSEYYMAQIAKAMGFFSLCYDLKLFYNQIVSSCEIFTSEDEGYIPIHYLVKNGHKSMSTFRLMQEIIDITGERFFYDLMLFDGLICNNDRHLGNFGMIVDNNTNKVLRPAPIFDNGFSMLNFLTLEDLKDSERAIADKKSFFNLSFNDQLKLFVQKRHIKNLEKLTDFRFKRHSEFNLDDKWLNPLEISIQKRARMALDFALQK